MKQILLLTSLLLALGCKEQNSTSSDPLVRKFPFDNSIYLNIPHQEEQSVLRRKLLNRELSNQLKIAVDDNEISKIKEGDEFKFIDESNPMTSVNLLEYEKLKSNTAEIIISYSDHLEIYFVPTGIDKGRALAQLGVHPEPESHFYWGEVKSDFLEKGNVYYLLSATKKELKENDVNFNVKKNSLGNKFNEKMFSFSSNQILELKVNVEYSEKETIFATLSGKKITCTRDMQEAGICEPCSYKLEAPSGRYISRLIKNSEELDLDIFINGKKYRFSEFSPVQDPHGNFVATISLKKMINADMGSFQIYQNEQYPVLKTVRANEISPSCVNKNVSNIIDITPKVLMNVEMTVKGRAFDNFL